MRAPAGFRYHMLGSELLLLLLVLVLPCWMFHRTQRHQDFVVILLSDYPKNNIFTPNVVLLVLLRTRNCSINISLSNLLFIPVYTTGWMERGSQGCVSFLSQSQSTLN